jgi:hypothetical protein
MEAMGGLGAHSGRAPMRGMAMLLIGVCWSCAHTSIRQVGDCDRVPAEQRIACAACTVKNEAKGWIGEYEYRPDDAPDDRCVRVK